MTSTPTTRGLMQKQGTGDNLNTWGALLNAALDLVDRWVSGWQLYTVSGNATLSWTNYSATNDFLTGHVKLTGPSGDGTLTSAYQITVPSVEFRNKIWNATGQAMTITTAAGTGVIIPNGARMDIGGDATNIYNMSPTHGPTSTQASDSNAYALWGAVQTAIAAATIPSASGAFLNSLLDTTAGYGSTKLTALGLLARTTKNPAANETSQFAITGYTASGTNTYSITASPVPTARVAFETTYLVAFTNGNSGAATFNDGLGALALTKNGTTALVPNDIPAGAIRFVVYDGTRFQIMSPVVVTNLGLLSASAVAMSNGMAFAA